ncbi:MAG TPA: peptidoglycan-binding domain-containing protein [Kofleriaceae bacterium]|jgi:hypothetical protein|nr:peptidoglycan-binding domain-containing protein [Kofleriaceae bacterium]
MGVVESNQWYAGYLGWTPGEFGCTAIDASLVAAIKDAQAQLAIGVDGVCGPATYAAMLAERQNTLVDGMAGSADPLADAGWIAVYEAKRTWLRDVIDLPPAGTPAYAESQQLIERMIRSEAGLGWSWIEPPYQRNFEWCGAFASYAWRAAGLGLPWRYTFFASTFRLDCWGRYQAFEKIANPRPSAGATRKMVELDESSGPLQAHFSDGDPPRAGDILLVGGVNTAYGKHVTVVESYDTSTGMFTTLEGNATGAGPTGATRHGVIRGHRPVGLPRGAAATTYHARRLIRPAMSDLSS